MDLAGIGLVMLVVSATLYFLPTIIAMARGKRNALAIFFLNLLLGWTFIAWAIALVWSLTAEDRRRNYR